MTGGMAAEPAEGPWTVLRLIRWSGEYLEEKGVERGRLDAEHLLADTLATTRLQLYLQFDRPLTPEELSAYKPLLLRRARREPLQYILGKVTFREIELAVDRRVLIPRPETEVLVDRVLAWARERGSGLAALDVGTGSGCIALSLALEGDFTRVVGTDASTGALEVARDNAEAAGLLEVLDLREGRLYEPVAEEERFDVVVSNPPYVAEGEAAALAPEVADWEPGGALYAGDAGLDVLAPLVAGASERLLDGGLLALEVGAGQTEAVAERVRATGAFGEPRVVKDLAGRPRIVLAERA